MQLHNSTYPFLFTYTFLFLFFPGLKIFVERTLLSHSVLTWVFEKKQPKKERDEEDETIEIIFVQGYVMLSTVKMSNKYSLIIQ